MSVQRIIDLIVAEQIAQARELVLSLESDAVPTLQRLVEAESHDVRFYSAAFLFALGADDALQSVLDRIDAVDLPPRIWIHVPANQFRMGARPDDAWAHPREKPQRLVSLSPFSMTATPITQAQFQVVMGYAPEDPDHPEPDLDHPVTNVSWYEAAAFCNALSALQGLPPLYKTVGAGPSVRVVGLNLPAGRGSYRLPTEAEWECACRAGTTTRFWWGDDASQSTLNQRVWWMYNSPQEEGVCLPSLVEDIETEDHRNAWGFSDMLGLVHEWVHDVEQPWTAEPATDPVCDRWPTDDWLRGGRGNNSQNADAKAFRASFRGADRPDSTQGNGFRCARGAGPWARTACP